MAGVVTAIRQAVPVAVLLAGTPVVLVRLAGPPLPGGLPSRDGLIGWVHDPLTPGFVSAVLAGGAWLIWSVLAVTVVAAVPSRLLAYLRRLPVLRLPPPVRALHAAVLGTAAVTTTTGGAVAAPPAVTADAHSTSVLPDDRPGPHGMVAVHPAALDGSAMPAGAQPAGAAYCHRWAGGHPVRDRR